MSTSKTELTAIPTAEDLTAIGQLLVVDEDGKKLPFGSLFEHQRTLVVFIRHFHCGLCKQVRVSRVLV